MKVVLATDPAICLAVFGVDLLATSWPQLD
jgi:hypothetical protein